jgi:hypothetical protein
MAKHRIIKQGDVYKAQWLVFKVFGIKFWYNYQQPRIGGWSDIIFKTPEDAENYIRNHPNREVVIKEIEL